MNNVLDFDKCSNCGACYNICPTNAITVDVNSVFYSIKIDNSKCIHCGKCKTVCPVNNEITSNRVVAAYGGYSNEDKIVRNSSSGGVFSMLAQHIINSGGLVYSAAFNDDYKSVIIKSSDDVDVNCLMRSKYVESSVGHSFREIKEMLEKGRTVLFCGSPCQAAGLKRFIGKEYDNLYICDFSCGGFSSHDMYRQHIERLEKKYGAKAKEVNFRKKVHGWSSNYRLFVGFSNGKEYMNLAGFDEYLYGFLNHYSIRDYCLQCKFRENHYSDIILADFWKYREISDFSANNNGISLVLINTDKGKELFDDIKSNGIFKSIDIEKASYNLHQRNYSNTVLEHRKQFIDDYYEEGLRNAAFKAGMPRAIVSLYRKIRINLSELRRNYR